MMGALFLKNEGEFFSDRFIRLSNESIRFSVDIRIIYRETVGIKVHTKSDFFINVRKCYRKKMMKCRLKEKGVCTTYDEKERYN